MAPMVISVIRARTKVVQEWEISKINNLRVQIVKKKKPNTLVINVLGM